MGTNDHKDIIHITQCFIPHSLCSDKYESLIYSEYQISMLTWLTFHHVYVFVSYLKFQRCTTLIIYGHNHGHTCGNSGHQYLTSIEHDAHIIFKQHVKAGHTSWSVRWRNPVLIMLIRVFNDSPGKNEMILKVQKHQSWNCSL